MEYLLKYARELGVERIASRALEYENVHGIVLSVHPAWLEAWKINLLGSKKISNTFFEDIVNRYRFFDETNDWLFTHFDTIIPYDLYWMPSSWKNYFRKSNLRVNIHLKPGSQSIKLNDEGIFEIVQEHRPVGQLSSAKDIVRPLVGGVSIGDGLNSTGTLGGILIDPVKNRKYGLTCAHVIPSPHKPVNQPSRNDNAQKATFIGNTLLTELPKSNGKAKCNIYKSSGLNEIDLALVEIDNQIPACCEILNIGKISRGIPNDDLIQGLSLEINGRTSGYKKLLLGGIVLVKQFQYNGDNYCFEKLVQLNASSFWSLIKKRPVSAGDSGAWTCAEGETGTEWCAMVVGNDRLSGYGILSENILKWLKHKGYSLNCF